MDVFYKTNSDYTTSTISGLTVIIPISDKCPKFNGMMKLTGIGSFLWEIFSHGSTITNACNLVVQKYDISNDTALTDIKEFVESLLENGLLTEIK